MPSPTRPTLNGSSTLSARCDGALMRPFQGRGERMLGLPWAASRLGGTCPRLRQFSLSGCIIARSWSRRNCHGPQVKFFIDFVRQFRYICTLSGRGRSPTMQMLNACSPGRSDPCRSVIIPPALEGSSCTIFNGGGVQRGRPKRGRRPSQRFDANRAKSRTERPWQPRSRGFPAQAGIRPAL